MPKANEPFEKGLKVRILPAAFVYAAVAKLENALGRSSQPPDHREWKKLEPVDDRVLHVLSG